IAALNLCRDFASSGKNEAEALAYLAKRGRDNARTPMQWDDGANAGFTDGVPWIGVNPDYTEVNAAAESGVDGSVFEHYRALIRLRRGFAAFAAGSFEELAFEDERIGGYVRRIGKASATVWCNFSGESVELPVPCEGLVALDSGNGFDGRTLAPWQSVVAVSGTSLNEATK
ncbi:MAG: DUF3459 domain-containing protein, partial [Spirochaetales bacterium]|nr:DUF3459 domain-containing protein [Spirochaetales bacterium]